MSNQGLLNELIQSLCGLPGIGPKSAQRMAFHLLQRNREGGLRLSNVLQRAMDEMRHCRECRTFTEAELCPL